MKLHKQPPEEGVELMMAPMIDIVFQLLIFFMVVATISDIVGNVRVVLPLTAYAAEDVNPPPDRLIINIEQDGTYNVGGTPRTLADLRSVIALEAKLTRDPNNPAIANRTILVRVDRSAPFKHAQDVMNLCTHYGLWRISFAGKLRPD